MSLVYSIQIRTAATGSYADLIASTLVPFYYDLKFPTSGQAQVEPCYDSKRPFVRALGNRQTNVTFSAKTVHASAAAAIKYLVTHPDAIPDLVDIQITVGTEVITFAGLVLTGFDPDEQTGISNNAKYTFTAGIPSAA